MFNLRVFIVFKFARYFNSLFDFIAFLFNSHCIAPFQTDSSDAFGTLKSKGLNHEGVRTYMLSALIGFFDVGQHGVNFD